ncbi:MAG: AhpC/TSA family protein [Ilumatobacter sp.]
MVFVYQGTADQGPMFFERLDSDAIAVADPDGELYEHFEIERGGWREMFGLRSWAAGIRATAKGHLINRKVGDAWTLPTIVAVRNERIVGEFRGRHAGDHPDVEQLFTTIETFVDPIDDTSNQNPEHP